MAGTPGPQRLGQAYPNDQEIIVRCSKAGISGRRQAIRGTRVSPTRNESRQFEAVGIGFVC